MPDCLKTDTCLFSEEKPVVKKTIYCITAAAVFLTVLSFLLYYLKGYGIALTFAITFGTISYHFLMRLITGRIVDSIMKNKADLTKKWYRCRKWEKRIYERLRVKRWGKIMPTFQPDYFDTKKHSWSEIAQAMCQSEVVHEIIVVLSFVPILFSIWAGVLPVFLITSVLSAGMDLLLVMLQRYNRSRVMNLIRKLPEEADPLQNR